MSRHITLDYFHSLGLAPFQAEFALDFCSADSPSHWELVAPVGTGKTFLANAIVRCQVASGARRVLVLAPRALLIQWQHTLGTTIETFNPLLVDRNAYLELQNSVPNAQNPWPDPALILMSVDLAKRSDMVESLTAVKWDLLIIDESHLLKGHRRNLAERLIEGKFAKRSLLLTATPGEPICGVNRKVWHREDLTDWEGKPLFKIQTKNVLVLEYKRTEEEQIFLKTLEKFAGELEKRTQAGRIHGPLLLRAASSSIFTAETMLWRLLETWRPLRNRLSHGMSVTPNDLKLTQGVIDSIIDEPEPLDIPERIDIDANTLIMLYRELESLVGQIDSISSDSKFDTLYNHLLKRWQEDKKAHLCVWTSFISTVQYLASALDDLEIPLFVLTGSLDWEIRKRRVDDFRDKGGILITTDVAADDSTGGIALSFVDECFNYDLPENAEKFEQRWGRFLRISRTSDFDMVLLQDTSKSLAWDEIILRLLKKTGWIYVV